MQIEQLASVVLHQIQTQLNQTEETVCEQIQLDVLVEKSGLVYVYDKEQHHYLLIDKNFSQVDRAKKFTEEQLIEHLKTFIRLCLEKNEYPSSRYYKTLFTSPSIVNYRRQFGSWEEAVEKTGMKDRITDYLRKEYGEEVHPASKRYSKEELLHIIEEFVKQYPNELTVSKFLEQDKTPSLITYNKHFGSWENALNIVVERKNEWNIRK